MNERLQRIADELGTSVYIDPTHGRIAKDNFVYGAAQQKLEDIEVFCTWLRKELNKTAMNEIKENFLDNEFKVILKSDIPAWITKLRKDLGKLL